ncbi:MAG TPA: heme ABC exporter ATP-binding protein CcmA [Methylomirabilota bacterium]
MQLSNFSGLSARDIEYWRGDRQVLSGLSLALGAGECLHVLGPNGAGKTTLLRIIAGLLTPEQGSVEWGGRPTRADHDAWCASFSYLAHSDGLKPELTARENLYYEVGLRRTVSDAEIAEALAQVGLAGAQSQLAGTLSAGQRRRLAVARILLSAAPLWILDEPYTNLDAEGTELVSSLIGRHLDAGGAALIAAHHPPAIRNHVARRLEIA